MPTIKKPNEHFGVLTYTGNGSSSATRSNTSAVNFTPDFVWIKQRSGTANHNLFDINRVISGDHKRLYSNDPAAEESSDYLGTTNLNGFINGGFTTGNGTNTNNNGSTYVAWNWKAGGASTVNTSGSISTNVSVNTTAGFSVFTFTGTGASASVGHGLGVAPKLMIFKRRNSTSNWNVLTNAAGSNQYGFLDLTDAFASAGETWTSTVINIGGNFANGGTYVCYAFAEVEGYSKFGSFTGNGSTDGPFVYLGFRPKFILIKNSSNVSNWVIFDTSRSPYNNFSADIYANISDAEYSGGINPDILSNGFKIRTSNSTWNGNGNTFIYAAFAESPFKYSNAR